MPYSSHKLKVRRIRESSESSHHHTEPDIHVLINDALEGQNINDDLVDLDVAFTDKKNSMTSSSSLILVYYQHVRQNKADYFNSLKLAIKAVIQSCV